MGGKEIDPNHPRCYLATYSYTSEGLDLPRLNTLILATPRADVKQAVGRILRAATETHPLVIDVVDSIGPCRAQLRKRRAYYEESGFRIDHKRSRLLPL